MNEMLMTMDDGGGARIPVFDVKYMPSSVLYS